MSNNNDAKKTKAQLITELQTLRRELAELRKSGPESATSSISDAHLLRVMLNLLPDHVYFKDRESRFIRISEAQAKRFGLESPDDAVGKTDFDFFSKEHAQPALEDELEVMKTGRALVKEEKEVWPDGQESWVLTTKAPFPDENGNFIGTFGISKDITERKLAEENLRRSRDSIENIINALDDPIFVKDQEHRWVILNNAMANFMGYPKEQLIGQTDRDFIPKEQVDIFWERDEAVLATGKVDLNEEELTSADGTTHTIATKKSIYTDPITGEKFIVAIIRDITELKQTQKILAKRANELETVARASVAISTILDTTELLQQVVDLTKNSFGLYHAHIYVLNEATGKLILTAGAGQVGQQMVAQGWQISLDQKQSLVARAARMRTGIIVNDVRQDPTWLPNHLLPHTRSEMAVPLLAGERVIGVLDVQSDQVDHFTADDIQIQSALATQVAVSLENARLFEETQATLAETAHLYQANRRINEVSDLTEMMAVIAETSHVPALNQLYLATFEHGPAGEVENLIVTANWFGGQGTPPPPVGTRFSVAAMPYKNLLFTLEPVFINDVLQDERLDFGAVAAIQEERIQSMAILPMWVSNRQIGVLLLKAASPHNFSKPEERLYASLARQVAVAVENQRLLAETQSAVAELEATQRRYTIQAWDAFRNRNVALRYEQTREQTNTPVVGLSATTKESTEPGIANGGQLPEPVGENSVSKDGQLPNVQNELVVPLKVRDQVIGVLGMQELFDTRRWTPEEMDLVEAIAEQIAQAAENLRLIDETQQTAAREARVNEIGEKIQSAQSLEEALRIAVREVGVSLQVPQTAVQLKVVN